MTDSGTGVQPGVLSTPGCTAIPTEGRVLVEVRSLCKHFGGVQAIHNVDFDVAEGAVHGLVGANGAGKSTFIRCLAGLVTPDDGVIRVGGDAVSITSPEVARRLRFAFIHQELNLVPQFNALENMLLGAPKRKRAGMIDWRAGRERVMPTVDRLGINFSLDTPVSKLSVAERWLVSIGRALVDEARLIAMDEPTASLSLAESERLYEVVRELSRSGVAILYVSHRLAEVIALCDNITVFRNGRVVRRASRGDLTRASLIEEIVGREIRPELADDTLQTMRRRSDAPKQVRVEVQGLGGSRGARAVRDVSFMIGKGEVLGLAGLVGAGRTELARLLVGADRPDTGRVLVDGREIRLTNPARAKRAGIALLPEERRSEALLLERSVAFNLNMAEFRLLRWVRWLPFISGRLATRQASSLARLLDIKTTSVDIPVGTLSGGNQQKVVIGRWLTRERRLLVLDELSRGVDVGARAEIHRILRDLAEKGSSILAISSELEELVELCDRIVVMAEGRLVGEVAGKNMTYENVLALCYGRQPLESGGERA